MDCIQENRNNKESLKETKWRTMDMGEWNIKLKHNGGVYGADKQSKGTLTPRGKNKWLNLVFCSNASSVPRSEWDGGERWVVVLQRPFLSLLYRF